jgi:hypothetical protein
MSGHGDLSTGTTMDSTIGEDELPIVLGEHAENIRSRER